MRRRHILSRRINEVTAERHSKGRIDNEIRISARWKEQLCGCTFRLFVAKKLVATQTPSDELQV